MLHLETNQLIQSGTLSLQLFKNIKKKIINNSLEEFT